ncbi:hypothetical protein D3C74_337330 [compost metagenome]
MVLKACSLDLLFGVDVASVDQHLAAHALRKLVQIDVLEHAPVGQQADRIAAFRRFFRQAAPAQLRMIILLSEVLSSNRIIQLHCSAFGHQALNNFPGRGFPDIVGVWLKGQAPDADYCTAQIAKRLMQLRDDHKALVFVHLNHRFQQLELVVHITCNLNQRISVFRETGAAITDTGLQEG